MPQRKRSRALLVYSAVSMATGLTTLCAALHSESCLSSLVQRLTTTEQSSKICIWSNAALALFLSGEIAVICTLFGSLSSAERERFELECWSTAAEAVLLLLIFRSHHTLKFCALLAAHILIKPHHWIYMERYSKEPDTNNESKFRMATAALALADLAIIGLSIYHNTTPILFVTESFALLCVVLQTISQHTSLSRPQFIPEMAFSTTRILLRLTFFLSVFPTLTLPVHTLRDIFEDFKSLWNAYDRHEQHTGVARWLMNTTQPVTAEKDVKGGTTCLVCRDELSPDRLFSSHPNGRSRTLPCEHAFHIECLSLWVERQNNCPTCRATIAPTPKPTPPKGHSRRFSITMLKPLNIQLANSPLLQDLWSPTGMGGM